MERKIALGAGNEIEIPERLHRAIGAETLEPARDLDPGQADDARDQILSAAGERLAGAAQIAARWSKFLLDDPRQVWQGVIFVSLFAWRKSEALAFSGAPDQGLQILSDGLRFGQAALEHLPVSFAGELSDLLVVQGEVGVRLAAEIGSYQVLQAGLPDLSRILDVLIVLWEPELASVLSRLRKIFGKLGESSEKQSARARFREVSGDLVAFKRELARQEALGTKKVRLHRELISRLAAACQDILQEELSLAATAGYPSEGLQMDIVQEQAEDLIARLEKGLRRLIADRFEGQFQKGWVEYIALNHQMMYDRWQRYRSRDQAAFRAYSDYAPELLDYALLEDLHDLIAAQWKLFQETLDFGYESRNRSVFLDKIQQIIRVRNAFAHHRSLPVNEVLRAIVLATDILMALDRGARPHSSPEDPA